MCALMIDRNWRDDQVLSAVSQHALNLFNAGALPAKSARCVLDAASYFFFHSDELRLALSESARSVSRDVPPPDEGDDVDYTKINPGGDPVAAAVEGGSQEEQQQLEE